MIGGKKRITERQNMLGKWMDVCTISEMLRSFRSMDAQIFRGFEFYESLYDERIVNNICEIALHIKEILNDKKKGKIIFSGCGNNNNNFSFKFLGTSGRIGWLSTRGFNRNLKTNKFEYIMAAGDKALLTSQEAPEDFPHMGEEDLLKVINKENDDIEKIVFFGITCGLSSLYVGGQIEHFLKHQNNLKDKKYEFISILLGFNPLHLARNENIPYWKKGTFLNLVNEIKDLNSKDFYFLNPIVGPEPIQGSSRMKGGSATKILIDVIFALATEKKEEENNDKNIFLTKLKKKANKYLKLFESTYQNTYEQMNKIIPICESSGETLKKKGHIFYLGIDEVGIYGIIDSSECLPTFGSNYNDIRGFLLNGWDEMDSHVKKEKMRSFGDCYHFSFEDFEQKWMPKLNENDTIILLGLENQNQNELKSLIEIHKKINKLKSIPKIFSIWISSDSKPLKNEVKLYFETNLKKKFINVNIPKLSLKNEDEKLNSLGIFSLKLVLNNISTISHVLKGTTYSNIMINVKLSNTKLVQRAIGIVSSILKVSEKIARKNILTAVYGDGVDFSKKTINDHVNEATEKDSIVPIAILLTNGKCKNVKEAKLILEKEPIVRNIITQNIKLQI